MIAAMRAAKAVTSFAATSVQHPSTLFASKSFGALAIFKYFLFKRETEY
jgi:hypothetical protein